jgi:hypothetical protein
MCLAANNHIHGPRASSSDTDTSSGTRRLPKTRADAAPDSERQGLLLRRSSCLGRGCRGFCRSDGATGRGCWLSERCSCRGRLRFR